MVFWSDADAGISATLASIFSEIVHSRSIVVPTASLLVSEPTLQALANEPTAESSFVPVLMALFISLTTSAYLAAFPRSTCVFVRCAGERGGRCHLLPSAVQASRVRVARVEQRLLFPLPSRVEVGVNMLFERRNGVLVSHLDGFGGQRVVDLLDVRLDVGVLLLLLLVRRHDLKVLQGERVLPRVETLGGEEPGRIVVGRRGVRLPALGFRREVLTKLLYLVDIPLHARQLGILSVWRVIKGK